MDRIDLKHHYIPSHAFHRHGCPSQITPTYRTYSLSKGEKTELIREYTTMKLVHKAKNGTIKNSLLLKTVHDQLELNSLDLQGSGSSNILLSNVSFDCLITDGSGKKRRDYICLNLKIPGANSSGKTVFSYDIVEKAYGGKKNLYEALGHFYDLGRAKINPQNHKHGHQPEYKSTSHKHDQYIRHTEQLLVAYLALPESAKMFSSQLRAAIRSKYSCASSVKVYNMGLHMHSTKTCCAPCEYTLLGLMNEKGLLLQPDKKGLLTRGIGFLANFSDAASDPSEILTITLPQKSDFRLLVTVSASEPDAHHKKQPRYTKNSITKGTPVPSYDISVKSQKASKHIFMSMLNSGYDRRRLLTFSDLNDITVGISGSRATRGSSGTIRKVEQIRRQKVKNYVKQFALLKI